ncbi:hypothetical protein SKAU_G00107790 [Synaphobranchus kaupii]|uniref:Uncharacterized protein n=1 Tax=Synaphobranchus kaupii TaxID=118154 RepID=A0A9Q1FZW3_SYNKA|nr:hypothetical protein SKAU_G00107790 [Synaphobranchus kaupii]
MRALVRKCTSWVLASSMPHLGASQGARRQRRRLRFLSVLIPVPSSVPAGACVMESFHLSMVNKRDKPFDFHCGAVSLQIMTEFKIYCMELPGEGVTT